MRRTGRWLAFALCALLLAAGCSASVVGGRAILVTDGPAAATRESWFGAAQGIALFVQWQRVGVDVTGSVRVAVPDAGTALTTEHAFVGVVGGHAVLLSVEAGRSAAAASISGSLDEAVLTLRWPSDGGAVIPVQMRTGTIDDFNRSLATATRTTPLPRSRTFDAIKVAAGVSKILTDAPPAGYGATGVGEVTCPSGEPVIPDTTFVCTVTINGTPKSVTITVRDSRGTYEVGVPS